MTTSTLLALAARAIGVGGGMRPVLAVVVMLAAVGILLVAVPVGPLHRWLLRRRMLATMDPALSPDERERARAVVRAAVPLRGRSSRDERLPAGHDPAQLRVTLTVPPGPDGCPGFRIAAPWHSRPALEADGGSRQVTTVLLRGGRALLVVVLGRVGQVEEGCVLAPAADRPHVQRAQARAGTAFPGEVVEVLTPAGPVSRHAFVAGRTMVTDTHVDRDGWAFVVGVVRGEGDTSLDGLTDAVLATWRWTPDAGEPAGTPAEPRASEAREVPDVPEAPVVPEAPEPEPASVDDAVPGLGLVLADDGGPVARCLVPTDPVATDVPCPDGTRTWVYLRLSPTAHLVVTSTPWDGTAGLALRDLEQPRRTAWGPSVTPAGPVTERRTGAGDVLVRTFRVDGVLRTQVRLDREGRSWTWSLTRVPDERHVLAALDDVLRTWQWAPFDDAEPAARVDAVPPPPG
ncbi:hypothetical protein [Cellulomonas xiejunii]|uniref:hypothetical protein n=1 Tax=Cellulomonas xiejunii TaxID=2968083 RepID=UPI001D0E071C|nr:hypothetical protein [Cellulomonas xiejunii]MCC2312696.1 hypothetical protein [Cellulomonas xiejunii]